jgi:hypothetical protein
MLPAHMPREQISCLILTRSSELWQPRALEWQLAPEAPFISARFAQAKECTKVERAQRSVCVRLQQRSVSARRMLNADVTVR